VGRDRELYSGLLARVHDSIRVALNGLVCLLCLEVGRVVETVDCFPLPGVVLVFNLVVFLSLHSGERFFL